MVSNHTDDVLNIGTISEKRMSGSGYDQSLDLGKFDAFKRVLERSRHDVIHSHYLQRVEVPEGL